MKLIMVGEMDDIEGRDTYVSQLKEVFDSCDTTGSQCLNEVELHNLCKKLHLTEHCNFLVFNLITKKGNNEVKFDDFKNCFVALLSQAVPDEEGFEARTEGPGNDENIDREVSPKFTFGRKKYGRRSRPASVADEDGLTSPDLSRQSSSELSSPSLSSASKHSQKGESSYPSPGKRPVSPSYPQQPPTKSGRLTNSGHSTDEACSESQDDSAFHRQRSNSDEINSSFENSPVEYLQQTWKKLGIGSDGYLTVDELALVCEHIGMDMTEEVIAQLFEKLDCDQDGRISFEEFLQGLFQHGEPQSCELSPCKSDRTSTAVFKETARDDQISNTSVSGIFSCLDSNNTGYADVSSILELWESLELPCSPRLLEELGFNVSQKVNLCDLTSLLEEELINSATTPLGQLAFVSYQNELNYLRQTNEQVRSERNKLRGNIEEANSRAALLAQEVDDNHAKLENALQGKLLLTEKKYQDQMRELVEELQQERDTISAQSNKMKQQLQSEIQAIKDEEAQLKNRLNVLEQENSRLELELQEATERCLEVEKQNELLQKELSVVPNLKERLADLESHHGEIQEKHHQALLLDIENYKRLNQELQDKIDELTLEIENLQQQNSLSENAFDKTINRTHSWLSDYKKGSLNGYKRRGSGSSSEDNSDDESPTIGKMRRTYLFPGDKSPFEPEISDEKYDFHESDGVLSYNMRKVNRPSSVDILLRDLFVDRENLMKKLYCVEESKDKTEWINVHLKHKCKVLSHLAYNAAKASVA